MYSKSSVYGRTLAIERSSKLADKTGRLGFIVPVSSISTDRYKSLQRIINRYDVWYSSFDDRPSRLFEGLEHIRLTIHILGKCSPNSKSFSTRYNKWNSNERSVLFETLEFAPSAQALVSNSMPKICSSVELKIISKIESQNEILSDHYDNVGKHCIFYSRKVGYFLQALNFQPKVLNKKGIRRPPSEFKKLVFSKEIYSKLCLSCLNSNLFYWFITVFSDCRHVNKREVDAFPIALDDLSKSRIGAQLEMIIDRLMKDIEENSVERIMNFRHDTLTVQCILPKISKSIIDEIDWALSRHYGFNEEETDFILNYDVKYRMRF